MNEVGLELALKLFSSLSHDIIISFNLNGKTFFSALHSVELAALCFFLCLFFRIESSGKPESCDDNDDEFKAKWRK